MAGGGNKYAHLGEPQDVLDFHGAGTVTGADVKRRTLAFVRGARGRGLERVRIVTGKGVHSAGRPLVRPQVERTLRQLEKDGEIASFRPEKVVSGGDGAFFVRLAVRG